MSCPGRSSLPALGRRASRSQRSCTRARRRPCGLWGLVLLSVAVVGVPAAAQDPVQSAPRQLEAEIRVAAVQLSLDTAMLRSLESYRLRIAEKVEQSLASRPDLIVFPEYTAAFLAVIPHRRELEGAGSVAEALERIRARDPLAVGLRELLLLNSGWVERALEEVFGRLAREHGVAILAGSYFARPDDPGPVRLTNRAVVFGDDGRRLYEQDKVYLTPFEEELLGLSPGEPAEARPFALGGARVGVTICRDTFFSDWEPRLAGSDLWVDIKANGTPYTQEERQNFERALPARIRSGEVPYGLTVCLTGEFLDLMWEGKSSLVRKEPPDRVLTVGAAASPQEEEILSFSVPLRRVPLRR